jgi:hypothetical protein
MNLRAVREGLRLLRLEAGLSLDEIDGIDRATVHRIENVRSDPDYAPRITSVAAIVEACGSTLAQFFATLNEVAATAREHPHLMTELCDEQTVRQVLGFLRLNDEARRALALAAPVLSAPVRVSVTAPTRAPKLAARTRHPAKRRRPSGSRKLDT